MGEDQKSRTTMSVLKMMGVVNPDGTTKASGAIPIRALSGTVDELLTLDALSERMGAIKHSMLTDEEYVALRARVDGAPAKIAAARAAGATATQISAAELKTAELADQLTLVQNYRTRYYVLSVAYQIARDFREMAGNGLNSSLNEAGGEIGFHIPGILTVRVDLAGADDEIPF